MIYILHLFNPFFAILFSLSADLNSRSTESTLLEILISKTVSIMIVYGIFYSIWFGVHFLIHKFFGRSIDFSTFVGVEGPMVSHLPYVIGAALMFLNLITIKVSVGPVMQVSKMSLNIIGGSVGIYIMAIFYLKWLKGAWSA